MPRPNGNTITAVITLSYYYSCVSWCTHIYSKYIITVSVKSVINSGNRSCYRKTYSTDNVHTNKADANTMSLCATWYANKVNLRGVHCK